jgi:predicted ester cyclase
MISGTLTGGGYFGMPASGKRVEINGTGIGRFENGRIVLMGV